MATTQTSQIVPPAFPVDSALQPPPQQATTFQENNITAAEPEANEKACNTDNNKDCENIDNDNDNDDRPTISKDQAQNSRDNDNLPTPSTLATCIAAVTVTVTAAAQEQHEEAIAESMALNDAFLALENMRRANLEIEFGGKSIQDISLLHQYCTACLHEEKEKEQAAAAAAAKTTTNNNKGRRQWRKNVFHKLSHHHHNRKKKSPPCLICVSPVCSKHGCRDFRKEGITICGHCAPLFTMDFIVDTMSNDAEQHRRQCIAHMIDSYDRALLMLRYSCQYIDEIATALEEKNVKNDQIGLGSSGIGLMSGLTGMAAVAAHFAAAATILSPAGPPLLIASILFGGTAAAAATGSEAINYYSEPNQLANKIIALHEMVVSLLAVTAVMKDALNRGHIDAEHYLEVPASSSSSFKFCLVKRSGTATTLRRIKRQPSSFGNCNDSNNSSKATVEQEESLDVTETDMTMDSTGDRRQDSTHKAMVTNVAGKEQKEQLVDEDAEDSVSEETETKSAWENSPEGHEKDDDTKDSETASSTAEATPVASNEVPVNDKKTVESANECSVSEGESLEKPVSDNDKHTKEVSSTPDTTTTTKIQKRIAAPSNTRVAVSRATTNAMKVAQIATIACGVLSAATIVLEAKNMNDTLESLRAGSPCEKAQMLRRIKREVEQLPETKIMAEECESYLRATSNHENLY